MVNGPHGLPDRGPESMARLHRPIADFVSDAARAGERAVSVAGDCCAAVPVLAGLRAGGDRADAGLDRRAWRLQHARDLALAVPGRHAARHDRRAGPGLDARGGRPRRPCPRTRIWLIDGRDLDPLERAALDASAVRRTGVAGLGSLRLEGPVMLHIDMDVLDAEKAPAFNYPVRGGPSVAAVSRACREFAAGNRLAAISVCGWTASLDTDGRTAAACRHVVEALVG